MDMKNLSDSLRNMYDVIKVLFIVMYGMDHKTLSIFTLLYGFVDKILHFTNLYDIIKILFSDKPS